MRLVLVAAFLSLFCGAPSFAQNGTAVLIDSQAFYDPQNGIPELVAIEAQLEREFAPVVAEIEMLQKQLIKRENEYRAAANSNTVEVNVRLQEQIEKESSTLRKKSQDAQLNAERRQKQLRESIEANVSLAIQTYAAEKKYDVVLDSSSVPLYASEIWAASYDRTADFIKWYRARPPG